MGPELSRCIVCGVGHCAPLSSAADKPFLRSFSLGVLFIRFSLLISFFVYRSRFPLITSFKRFTADLQFRPLSDK